MPIFLISFRLLLETSMPFTLKEPSSISLRHVNTSTNSDWPLPSTPAIPKISPALRLKDAPFSPTMACISPSSISRLTLSLAKIPGNCFVKFFNYFLEHIVYPSLLKNF